MSASRVVALVLLGSVVACAAPASPPSSARAASPPAATSTSTIDARLQAAVETELDALARDAATREAVVVAIDPRSGAILAMAGRDANGSAPNLPARTVYMSGSVAKVFSAAAALDAGVVRTTDTFSGSDFEMGGDRIVGSTEHPTMTTEDVLAFSSNVGAARIYERLGKARLHDALVRFGFGERPSIEGAASGELGDASRWSDFEAVKIAFGAGLRATPLQYALAFAAVAGGGEWHGATLDASKPRASRRAMSRDSAAALMTLLEGVVHRDDGTGAKARVDGLRVSGKTGTASLDDGASYASFVGAVPAGAPRLVVYVGVKTTARGYSGGTIAAPAFARIVANGFAR